MVISRKLSIKPGCIRSVHIRKNGSASWHVMFEGKFHRIPGKQVGNSFVADEKYQYIIDQYVPKRTNRKKNNVEIKIAPVIQKRGTCIFNGEPRRIQFSNSSQTRGQISWKGKVVNVLYENGIAKEIVK